MRVRIYDDSVWKSIEDVRGKENKWGEFMSKVTLITSTPLGTYHCLKLSDAQNIFNDLIETQENLKKGSWNG